MVDNHADGCMEINNFAAEREIDPDEKQQFKHLVNEVCQLLFVLGCDIARYGQHVNRKVNDWKR